MTIDLRDRKHPVWARSLIDPKAFDHEQARLGQMPPAIPSSLRSRQADRRTPAQIWERTSEPHTYAVNVLVRRVFTRRVRFGWLGRRSQQRTRRLTSLGYCFLPAATWLIADLHSSLRLVRADLIQANFAVRRCASAQRCFTSFVHAFAAAAVRVNKF